MLLNNIERRIKGTEISKKNTFLEMVCIESFVRVKKSAFDKSDSNATRTEQKKHVAVLNIFI